MSDAIDLRRACAGTNDNGTTSLRTLWKALTGWLGARTAQPPTVKQDLPHSIARACRLRNDRDTQVILHDPVQDLRAIREVLDVEDVDVNQLQPGDVILVPAGEMIPTDGEIVHGCASLDQSATTGESSPVVREAGRDSDNLRGAWVLEGHLVIRVARRLG
jgi:hypothetical protein